ncbi:MAG TPA: hypothetical protein VHM30_18860 [Gemmatimonadaceae bacterium]|nr:hypothetical protein [Gemmatimonadaceae bacterium]
MRRSHVVVLVLALGAAGVLAYRFYRRAEDSPFSFGMERPGRKYSDVEREYQQNTKGRLSCTAVAAGYRVCRGRTDGPAGDVAIVVNPAGRVVIYDQRVSESSAATRDLTQELTARWNEIEQGTPVKRLGKATRWVSENRNYSALMVLHEQNSSLSEVVLTDERSLRSMDARTLPALLVLAREGLVGPEALDAAERRAPGSLSRAADALAEGAKPLADAAARLPRCGPQPALGIDPGMGRRRDIGDGPAAIMAQAVANVYPGLTLELRDSAYLVDKDGVPELIEVSNPVAMRNGTVYAFAVSFMGRAGAVLQSTQVFDTPSCRAPAEIIIARVDPRRRTVTRTEHFTADDEGLASRISAMEIVAGDGAPRLVAHTTTTYGAADWYGEVDWLDTASPDSLRVLDRRPTTVAKMDRFERLTAMTWPADAAAGDAAARRRASTRLTAIEQRGPVSRPQQVVVPAGIDGTPSGWTLLTIL